MRSDEDALTASMKRLRTQIKDFYTKHGSPDTPAGNTELNNLEQQ
eukprot:SAG31_NODE_47320_length_250_cov_3.649007_1_plen_44_part_10